MKERSRATPFFWTREDWEMNKTLLRLKANARATGEHPEFFGSVLCSVRWSPRGRVNGKNFDELGAFFLSRQVLGVENV